MMKYSRVVNNYTRVFLRQENSATLIQLHFKELCGGCYSYTSVSKPEMTIDFIMLLELIFTTSIEHVR